MDNTSSYLLNNVGLLIGVSFLSYLLFLLFKKILTKFLGSRLFILIGAFICCLLFIPIFPARNDSVWLLGYFESLVLWTVIDLISLSIKIQNEAKQAKVANAILIQTTSKMKLSWHFLTKEMKNSWWHRLVIVCGVLSTITVVIIIISLFIKFPAWQPNHHVVYSFDSGFNKIEADVKQCSSKEDKKPGLITYPPNRWYISCGVDPSFLTDLSKDIYFDYFNAVNKAPQLSITSEEAAQFLVDNGIVNNLSQKRFTTYNFGEIFAQAVFLIVAPLVWFLLYYQVIYRTIVYIIFGSVGKKQDSA